MPKCVCCACQFIPNRFRVAKTVMLQLLQLVDAMCKTLTLTTLLDLLLPVIIIINIIVVIMLLLLLLCYCYYLAWTS